jgi:hypothetical protein
LHKRGRIQFALPLTLSKASYIASESKEIFLSLNASSSLLRAPGSFIILNPVPASLIAVSNKEFYKSKLVIFPSPHANTKELGLKFNHLPDTYYDRGGSMANIKEAEAVAQAVMIHAKDYPEQTLGVGAFSQAQMQAIIDQLEIQITQDNSCENFFQNKFNGEEFFVKNLENLQGDERDVIFVSIGYGKDQNNESQGTVTEIPLKRWFRNQVNAASTSQFSSMIDFSDLNGSDLIFLLELMLILSQTFIVLILRLGLRHRKVV